MPLDAQLTDRLFSSPQLPSLPAIALQIIEMVQEDEVDIDMIAKTISLDPALSTKMLKTVNSSFYGLPKTVGSVHQAVVVLGLNSVKTLALGFSLVGKMTQSGGEGFDHMAFWRRSLYCATAAKQLCDKLNIVQAEEVFMASLLQDVGVLALAQVLGRQYATLMRNSADDHRKLAPIEQETLGGDHIEVGAALAESWGLPPLLVESIRMHESPEEAPENLKPLIRTVAAGALAADLIEHPEDTDRVATYYQIVEQWFGLDRDEADALLREVFTHASEAQRLFELPTGELGNPDMILAKASEVLSKVNAEQGQKKISGLDAPEPAGAAEPGATEAATEAATQAAAEATAQAAAEALLGQVPQAQSAPASEPAPAPEVLAPRAEASTPSTEPKPEPEAAMPEKASRLDALTGVYSRRSFDEQIDELFLQAGPEQPVSLVFVDIDEFQLVNNTHGIQDGDVVLRAVADTVKWSVGSRGEVFRFNEDEFTVLCPGMTRHDAALLAEELRSKVEQARYEIGAGSAGKSVKVTASIGVATYEGTLFKRPDQLVKAASKGVYAAKDGGRNIVRVFVPRAA